MNLKNKKKLIARTLNVGIDRIAIKSPEEVKEAITRQDILDLLNSKLIVLKPGKGRRIIEKRKGRRRMGSIRKRPGKRKEDYMILTRKLRNYLKSLRKNNKIEMAKYIEIRHKIRARSFKSLANLQDYLGGKK